MAPPVAFDPHHAGLQEGPADPEQARAEWERTEAGERRRRAQEEMEARYRLTPSQLAGERRMPEGADEEWAAQAIATMSAMDYDFTKHQNDMGWSRITTGEGHTANALLQGGHGLTEQEWKAVFPLLRIHQGQIGLPPSSTDPELKKLKKKKQAAKGRQRRAAKKADQEAGLGMGEWIATPDGEGVLIAKPRKRKGEPQTWRVQLRDGSQQEYTLEQLKPELAVTVTAPARRGKTPAPTDAFDALDAVAAALTQEGFPVRDPQPKDTAHQERTLDVNAPVVVYAWYSSFAEPMKEIPGGMIQVVGPEKTRTFKSGKKGFNVKGIVRSIRQISEEGAWVTGGQVGSEPPPAPPEPRRFFKKMTDPERGIVWRPTDPQLASRWLVEKGVRGYNVFDLHDDEHIYTVMAGTLREAEAEVMARNSKPPPPPAPPEPPPPEPPPPPRPMGTRQTTLWNPRRRSSQGNRPPWYGG